MNCRNCLAFSTGSRHDKVAESDESIKSVSSQMSWQMARWKSKSENPVKAEHFVHLNSVIFLFKVVTEANSSDLDL